MAERAPRRFPLWSRILIGAVATVVVLALAGVGLRYWITSDMGRGFIVSMIDGRRLPGLGTMRIVGGLKGDPLTDATLADIALVDDDGPWLRANDLRLQWDGTKLLSGQLEIEAIDVGRLHVLRRPGPNRQEEKGGKGPDIGIELGHLAVRELRLEPDVLGPPASFTVTGAFQRGKDGAGHADLLMAPISGPGDRIEAGAQWTADGVLTGKADAGGPAGGALATLLQAPAETGVRLAGSLSGSLIQFTADARLSMGDVDTLNVHAARTGDAADLNAELHAGQWPLFNALTERTGADLSLALHANLADFKAIPLAADLMAPAGRLNASLTWRGGDRPFDVARIEAAGLDLARVTGKAVAGAASARGDLTPGARDFADLSWRGDVTVDALVAPGAAAQRATAKATVARQGDRISWQVSQGEAQGVAIDALKDLKPAPYQFSSFGDVNLKTNLVTLSRVQVRGDTFAAAGQGSYAIKSGALKLEGVADVARLSALSPFAGVAHGDWGVERKGETAPIRISANVAGRNIASSNETLARLAGPNPKVQLSAYLDHGRFMIESGEVYGDGLEAHMTGRLADTGEITGHAIGRLRRPIVIGGQRFDALSFDADVSGKSSAPVIDAHFADGEALVGGLDLSGLGGDAHVVLGDRTTGRLALAGTAQDQTLKLRASVAGDKSGWVFSDTQLQVGALKADATRLAIDKAGDLDLAWRIAGPLAGFYGVENGLINARGSMKTADGELTLESSGQVTQFRRAAASIDLASFTASAGKGRVTLESRIKGEVGAPIDLTIKGQGASHGAGDSLIWSGEASLDGQLDRAPISTPQPVAWTYGAEGWSIAGGLRGLGGRVDGRAELKPHLATAEVKLDSVNLRAITRLARTALLAGDLTGSAMFRNDDGRATGELTLDAARMNPAGVSANPVNIHLTGALADNRLTLEANGAGQGFSLQATSHVRVRAGQGFDLAPDVDAPLDANLALDGRAEPAWALFGPEGQALRGHVVAHVAAGGTIASPTLDGEYRFEDGAYEHGETGLKLVNIVSSGKFNQRSVTVASLDADDGQGGKVTGGGDISWERELDGGLKFHVQDLHALGRPDRSATVSGDGAIAFDKDAVRVTGALDVEQARVSVEQPAAATVPTLPKIRRVNFPAGTQTEVETEPPAPERPVVLDMTVKAPRRIFVFGRGLDTEWSADFQVTGQISDPVVHGAATLVRGDLDLAGRRFQFDTGTITFNGPIRTSRIDISATRNAADITASVHVTGTPVEPKFTLESTPELPQDEILARVLFGRSAAQLSALEAAQLAAGLAQLAGGQAGFNPAGLLRQATGLDRVSVGATGGTATVEAGKYLTDNVYLQLGAGGTGGVGATVEWEPRPNLEITSSAQGNGDTRIGVRWKKDYDKPPGAPQSPASPPAPESSTPTPSAITPK